MKCEMCEREVSSVVHIENKDWCFDCDTERRKKTQKEGKE